MYLYLKAQSVWLYTAHILNILLTSMLRVFYIKRANLGSKQVKWSIKYSKLVTLILFWTQTKFKVQTH